MNNAKILLWSAGILLSTSALVAQGVGPGAGPNGWRGSQIQPFSQDRPMSRFLNLSESQRDAMKVVADKHQASLDSKRAAVTDARTALRSAVMAPSSTDAQVKALQAKVSEAQVAVILERRTMVEEMQAFLNPDQKAAFEGFRTQGGPGRGMRRGGGSRCAMGPF